jgi:hypothetical protein
MEIKNPADKRNDGYRREDHAAYLDAFYFAQYLPGCFFAHASVDKVAGLIASSGNAEPKNCLNRLCSLGLSAKSASKTAS